MRKRAYILCGSLDIVRLFDNEQGIHGRRVVLS
jgi:hypothetical protein